jgi:hypothetical protein
VAPAARLAAVQRRNWTAQQALRSAAERGPPLTSRDELHGDARIAAPFSGGSFAYRVDGGACTLYSFGPDLDDDGGRPARTCRSTGTAGPPDDELVFWPLED